MTTPTPVPPTQRITELDAMRGFAIIGILFMNLAGFNGGHWADAPSFKTWTAWWDQAALWILNLLIAGKMNALLSFIFGIGFALLMERLSRQPRGTWSFVRRMVILFVFGAAHAIFLFYGDVLQIYALLGLALLAVRGWSDRALLVLTLCLFLTPAAYQVAMWYAPPAVRTTVQASNRAFSQNYAAVHKLGNASYREATVARREFLLAHYRRPRFYFGELPYFGTTILLGFILGRRGWPVARERLTKLRRWVLPLLLTGWTLSTINILFYRWVTTWPRIPPGSTAPYWYLWYFRGAEWTMDLQRLLLMAAYASMLVWLIERAQTSFSIRWMAAAGRTPLSNYISQSLICAAVFHGYGLGFAGRCGPALTLLVAPAIGITLAACSVWWLHRFSYGPLEWLWRSLSVSRPARKDAELAAASSA